MNDVLNEIQSAVSYGKNKYHIEAGETVLECLLRNEENIPYSCKAGTCQNCMVQSVDDMPPENAQTGLKPTFKAQKFAVACQWKPQKDIAVKLPTVADTTIAGTIISIAQLCHNVKLLQIKPQQDLDCIAGQYLTLINSDNVARSYSIANLVQKNGHVDFHIRIIPDGQMSTWLENKAQIGTKVHLRGPAGNCFYSQENDSFPMLLAGTGTGLAPLNGIIEDALAQGHKGKIVLYHGALIEKDLYYQNHLQNLAKQYDNFDYIPCVLNGENNEYYRVGNIENIVLSELSNLDANLGHIRAYLCGAPDFVNSLRKRVFLSGLASKNIYYDAFLPRSN